MGEDMKEVSGPRKNPDAGRIVVPVCYTNYSIYRVVYWNQDKDNIFIFLKVNVKAKS
jgi:hypothetical protein